MKLSGPFLLRAHKPLTNLRCHLLNKRICLRQMTDKLTDLSRYYHV